MKARSSRWAAAKERFGQLQERSKLCEHLVASGQMRPILLTHFWWELTRPTLLQAKLPNLVCNNNKIPHIEFQGIPPSPPPISPPTIMWMFEFSYGWPDLKTTPHYLLYNN